MNSGKIIICDDDALMRGMLTDILKDKGFETTSVSTGVELIKCINHEDYDLIIVDYIMPVIDGLQTIMAIRNILEIKTVPIVMITAAQLDRSGEVYLDDEHIEVLPKPFDIRQLNNMLTHYFH